MVTMKNHLLLSVLLSFLCFWDVFAQNNRLYGSGEYGAGEMSCNLINSICQDSLGYIWIGTEYGLNKFDGIAFTQYLHNEKDTTSLLGNNIRRLKLENDKTLWICCINGLQNYHPETDIFNNVRVPENGTPLVSDVQRLRSGELWITTSGRGLYNLKKDSWDAEPVEEVNKLFERRFFNCIYEDSQGNIWIGTNYNGLVRINPKTKEIYVFQAPAIPDNMINGILEDGLGQLFVNTATSIMIFDRNSAKFNPIVYTGTEYLSIRNMVLSRKGGIFVGTDGQGLKYIDAITKKMSPVENGHTSFNFNIARIHALMEDRDMNLCLGCFQKGILMMPNEPTQFGFWGFSGREYKLGGAVTSICKDQRDNVWCSVDNEGIFQFNENGKIIKHLPQPQATVKIFEDSERTLWVSSHDKGLTKLNGITGQFEVIQVPIKGYVKTIAEDKNKNLYLSTFGTGFIRYNLLAKKWEEIELQNRDSRKGVLPNRWINAIICDSKGLVWLGHYKGVSVYDPKQDLFLNSAFEDSISQQICLSLMEDRLGNVWVGTYNGLFRVDAKTKRIRNYTTENGLSNNVICGLVEDNSGDIWCSTFCGINQIKIKEDRIINYYTGNGLVDKIYNRGVYFHDKEDIIYFGGNSGITLFSPQNITIGNYEHQILITNLYINNQQVNANTLSGRKPVFTGSLSYSEKFRFSYEDNTFMIEFSTMDFKNPENIHYEYRLKELSNEWSATQPGINRITYNHLSPGNYTLEVRACKYGSYSPVKQIKLSISPPWYKSVWANIIYIFLLLGIAVLIIYLIHKKRKEIVSEAKLRFFIDISHEIRSPMTLIISPLEKLMKSNHDESTMRTLEGMHRNAKRILGLINQLLDIRKIDKGQMQIKCNETDMVRFINELVEVFDDQAKRRNIKFAFEHHMDILPVWIDRNNFDKVLMNILSNAFKFTPDKGEITILLTSGIGEGNWGPLRHFAEIRIIDSGIGIDEDKIEKIFARFYQAQNELTFGSMGSGIGLNLSRTLVELHQGTISATNRKDAKGSCFTIRIPLGKDHLKKENLAKNEPGSRLILQNESFNQSKEVAKKTVKSKTNYKILIVDDEDEIREYLKEELQDTYKIITANNGNEALQMALSQMPDLILSDVVMPEMDGFTFVKKLKSNSNVSHIPVIILSSKAEHEDRMEGLDKGADAYLTKPFNTEELSVMVGNLINTRQVLKGKFSGAQDQQDKVKSVDFKSSNEILMDRIMTIINDNMSNPELNVEMLVSKVGLSRVQLHRKLKELTGIPASDFIRNIRLKQAAELLREKKMNVSQVAYAVGFTNQTHFSTAFKKFFGLSPTEYIAQAE